MERLIETIGEIVQTHIDNYDITTAKYITSFPEEWYEKHIHDFDSVRELFRDPVFDLVYYIGIDNIYWSDVNCSLESHFCDIFEQLEKRQYT